MRGLDREPSGARLQGMLGYSGTPLPRKLGIKEGHRLSLVSAPRGFKGELGELPPGVRTVARTAKDVDVALLFTKRAADLKRDFARQAKRIVQTGMVWVAWPKRSSGVATDLSFDIVRSTGLAAGLVDTKVCAVDDTWSGLKFMIRVKDRKS